MKNAKKLVAGLVKTVAEKELQRDANRTSCNLIYQPKVPRNLNRFKKNQK
ncbi:MAG: cyclic lactone autoinducer peptide [Eubacteriales bacterium]|nr:cyclic lactone autoinducer peptide [Eubacteriales bacterium]